MRISQICMYVQSTHEMHLLFWLSFEHVNFNNSKNSKIIVFAMHIRYFMYSDFICIILPHRLFHLNALSLRFWNQLWGPSDSAMWKHMWKEENREKRKTLTMSSVNVDKTKTPQQNSGFYYCTQRSFRKREVM